MKKIITISIFVSVALFAIIGLSSCEKEIVDPQFDIDLNFAYTDSTIKVKFTNKSENGVSYNWDFGDGENKNSFEPIDNGYHHYKRGGTYNVTLTVFGNDEKRSITKTVKISNLVPKFKAIVHQDTTSIFNEVELILDTNYASLGNVKVYWDYGDGESSETTDVKHCYWFKNGGNHSITLRLSREEEEVEITKSISLHSLHPDFKYSIPDPDNRNRIIFRDSSFFVIDVDTTKIGKKNIPKVKYYWNFGDGEDYTYTSDSNEFPLDSIEHEYSEGGKFPVTLKIEQGEESKEITKSISIPKLSVDFEIDSTVNNTVYFTPVSQHANDAEYTWDFGDENIKENEPYKSVKNEYKNGGIYVVTLTVTKNSEVKQISKVVNLPTLGVDFSFKPDEDYPKKIIFTPNVTNSSNVKNYKWSFGDGDVETRYDAISFPHPYKKGGFYSVTLSVTEGEEVKSVTKSFSIQSLTACFTDTIINKYNVKFTNCSNATDEASFNWDFGDGTSSTEKNPSKMTYNTGGVYTVSLTVTDGSETKTYTQSINIEVLAPCFTYTTNNHTVDFDANCSVNTLDNADYNWNFGDGTNSTEKTPSKTYDKGGVYDVILEITQGPETKSFSKSISIAALIPDFNVIIPSNCPAPCEIEFKSTSVNVPTDATYSWEFGDGQQGTGANTSNTYNSGGIHTVIMTINTNGEEYSVSKIVNIPALTANFNVIGDGCNASCAITLENTSINVPVGYTYHWNYGVTDEYLANNNTFHTTPDYINAGVYTINLQIKNGDIVVAETYRSVTINGGTVNLYQDLLAYYPFTNSLDNVVGTNSGETKPDTVYYFDRKGSPLSSSKFNGNRFINSNSSLPTTDNLSISFWIKQEDNDFSGKGTIIFDNQLHISYENYKLKVDANGTINEFTLNSSSSWVHFVINFYEGEKVEVFENSVLKTNEGSWSNSFTGSDNLYFGGKNSSSDKFEGFIDDIRIYTRRINQLEVKALYNE